MLDYALIKISLRAVITLPDNSHVIDIPDVIGFTSSFAVNTIPTGMLSVAVGKLANALSKDPQFATIHSLQTHLTTRSKVYVYMLSELTAGMGLQKTARPAGNDKAHDDADALASLGVPGDGSEILIFEGNVTGIGRSLSSAGTAVATIQLEHWMTNLNYASALSASSDPGNPNDMVFSAAFRARSNTVNQSGFSTGETTWIPTAATEFVRESSMDDIWGNILFEWLKLTTKADPFVFDLSVAGVTSSGDTAPILDAIERLKPNADGEKLTILMENVENSPSIIDGIRSSLIKQTGTNWVNTTLWGKLVGEWAPEYFFSIIPRVSDGLIVPFTGPLSGEPWAVIGNEDYIFARTDVHVTQLLRGVGIIHPSGTSSGFNLGQVGSLNVKYGGFAGFYLSEHTTTGMMLVKYPPRWLANQHRSSKQSGKGEGVKGPVLTVMDGDKEVPPGDDVDHVQEAAAVRTTRDFMARYAQQHYAIERLKGRNGEIAGKLRFDICPGSNIKVEADTAAQGVNAVEVIQEFYATVMTVNYVFDVEGQRAGTSFIVTHVHTSAEHNSGTDLVTARPAIYANAWRGASMIAGIKPETKT